MDLTLKGAVGSAFFAGIYPGISSLAFAGISPTPFKSGMLEVLNTVGKTPIETILADGTSVVLLPYGGRVLGVYAPGSEENFYWANPALASTETAKSFFESEAWKNSGGDRTWLAPEVDIFLPHFPDTKTYFQPRELDPGNYQVKETPEGPQLVNDLRLHFSRSDKSLSLRITKSVSAALNPLRFEKQVDLADVEYAGYTQNTSLEILDASPAKDTPVGLWNLVQMPHGGEMLIPTYRRTEPKIWFGEVPGEDLKISDHLIRYRMRAKGEQKLGVLATASPGRVGYLHGEGATRTLIVRNFTVNPSGEYVDVPWQDTEDLGYSTQACNVNSGLGSFSELEYHIPAVGGKTGQVRCEDCAQVWAFRAGPDSIKAIAGLLLSQEV